MMTNTSEITAICDRYREAVYEKDVAAFLDLYHTDARVFDTWSVWSYAGARERKPVIEKWFSSLGEDRVQVSFDRTDYLLGQDLAGFSARATYVGLSADSKVLRSMQNRLTWFLKQEGGLLKIFHEHTSVPIGFPDLKGILGD